LLFFITNISCGDTSTQTKTSSSPIITEITPPSENAEDTIVPPVNIEETRTQSSDDIIKKIESNLTDLKKEKEKDGECYVEKYTSLDGETAKVKTKCYDGNVYSCQVERYYQNGQVYLAKVYHEKYNASPMDKENFDKTKSVITKRTVFFKNGDINSIDKILDENNEVATIEGNLEMGWEQAISF
jgi:hypothetical protein